MRYSLIVGVSCAALFADVTAVGAQSMMAFRRPPCLVLHRRPPQPHRMRQLPSLSLIPSLDDRNSSARRGPGGSRLEDACFASEGFSSAGLGISLNKRDHLGR